MCSPLLHGGDIETLNPYAPKFLEYVKQADFADMCSGVDSSFDAV